MVRRIHQAIEKQESLLEEEELYLHSGDPTKTSSLGIRVGPVLYALLSSLVAFGGLFARTGLC